MQYLYCVLCVELVAERPGGEIFIISTPRTILDERGGFGGGVTHKNPAFGPF